MQTVTHRRRSGPLAIALVAGVWWLASAALETPLLPGPQHVARAFAALAARGEVWVHLAQSALHIGVGFACAAGVGVAGGVALALSDRLRAVLLPVLDGVRGVPALALFPLIILAAGLGVGARAFVIFWTAWPAVLLNTLHGIWQVDPALIDAARLDTSSRWVLVREIALPLARPAIFTGFRVGLSGAWISVFAAEMLGGSAGLGYRILQTAQTFRYPEMYAYIVLVGLAGLAMNAILSVAEPKLMEGER